MDSPHTTHRFANQALRLISTTLWIAYPLMIYFGLKYLPIRHLAFIVMLPALLLFLSQQKRTREKASQGTGPNARHRWLALPLLTLSLLTLAATLDSVAWMLAVPVLINAVLFFAFVLTLRGGKTPMIEELARLVHSDLRAEEVRWCRLWTWVWVFFFATNAFITGVLATQSNVKWWTLHTSGLSYLAIALLIGGEWLLRKVRFRRFNSNPFEQWLRRWSSKQPHK